jgi:phosphate transport system protein
MPELLRRIDHLMLRLDRMGLRCQQAVLDALAAVETRDVAAGAAVEMGDADIDREEVEIEQECIRLLALYQPAAGDLRTVCFAIKANNDLERIADKAASIGHRIKHLKAQAVDLSRDGEWRTLARQTTERLDRTLRAISMRNVEAARDIIAGDQALEHACSEYIRKVLARERNDPAGVDIVITLALLARALERIAELCTNIAEDVVFLCTGNIVRHAETREEPPA